MHWDERCFPITVVDLDLPATRSPWRGLRTLHCICVAHVITSWERIVIPLIQIAHLTKIFSTDESSEIVRHMGDEKRVSIVFIPLHVVFLHFQES